MYKIKGKIQRGVRRNLGGDAEESSFRENALDSATLIDHSVDFLVGGELGMGIEGTLPSTSKSVKRKFNDSSLNQVESKKLKDDKSNILTRDGLSKEHHKINSGVIFTELQDLQGINVDGFDLSFLDGIDLSLTNDIDLSWFDTFQGSNTNHSAVNWQQGKSSLSPTYKIPLIKCHQKDNADEVFAKLAFEVVRKRFSTLGVKSGNKRTPSDIKSMERLNRAGRIVFDIQSKINYKRQLEGVNDFTLSMEQGAGNCGEMSGCVAQIINLSGGKAAQYRVDDYGTHAFALSGEPPAWAVDHIKMSDYKGCWVVDPWAGIVCEAPDYCDEFKTKMNKWALKGKEVFSHGSWMIADNPLWVNAVINGEKKVNIPHDNFLNG